jgi:hypothetical protein
MSKNTTNVQENWPIGLFPNRFDIALRPAEAAAKRHVSDFE